MSDLVTAEPRSHETATKKSKKKRKREKQEIVEYGRVPIVDESINQPSLGKSPTEQPPINVKVELFYDRTDKSLPVVGYFPSGYNPDKAKKNFSRSQESNEERAEGPSVKLYRNAQRAKIEKNEKSRGSERLELVVTPNDSNVDFVGKSYKGEAMAAQLCSYALGVLDKETGTLKVMPIAGNKIFRLDPKIRGLDTAEKEVVENPEASGVERAEKIRDLNMRYGSKKSVNQDKKMMALNQADDPESKEFLGAKIDSLSVNKDALESTGAHVARNIPPHNLSATTPKEAYPLSKIILSGESNFLDDIYNILGYGSKMATGAYPVFVRNRIYKLQDVQNEDEKRSRSHILSYINHLVKFKDMHSLDGASSAKDHRFPSILRQKFMGVFSPEGRRLSPEKINLLISYVLVLTLYADDFRTDPADIAMDLRMSSVALRAHFENLGCKLVRDKGTKLLLATLPVPLQFPKLRQKRRR